MVAILPPHKNHRKAEESGKGGVVGEAPRAGGAEGCFVWRSYFSNTRSTGRTTGPMAAFHAAYPAGVM
jgi:hypothetical protein